MTEHRERLTLGVALEQVASRGGMLELPSLAERVLDLDEESVDRGSYSLDGSDSHRVTAAGVRSFG